MAQQAEEYGSHDKTFEIPVDGTVRVVNRAGDVVMQHDVAAGDVWRACQVKDVPVRDWVRLAVERGRLTGAHVVFWLDETRGARRADHREGAAVPPRARHVGAHHRDPGARGRVQVLARADPPRRGHHLGHRQRAPRLPHRPVPDHGARHERQDAVDRAAHERWRPLRDGCRRLRAEARAAVRQGEPPALGLARRVPRARGVARVPGAARPATRPRSCSPTRSTVRRARC